MQAQCSVQGATIRGVEAVPVSVEVSVGTGMPGFSIVGMPDAAIQEARERVRAAVKACGFRMPADKVVVNLAPGSLKKSGSGFDLPIALGILAATRQIDASLIEGSLCVGELSLEGELRAVKGMLAFELCARNQGLSLVCAQPEDGLIELEGLVCRTAASLSSFRRGSFGVPVTQVRHDTAAVLDFSDVSGHEAAKRALQVAAAGGHGVLMMGPPGSGKTMLASRLPSILPPLTESEKVETALVHSVAGEDIGPILAGKRPFRKPHHSASMAGLVGGGTPPRPGEISLATGGVLFLDEFPEFKPSVLQAIRQPIESGRIAVTRAEGSVVFPARFMLVAASNPCPCGYFGDTGERCSCTAAQIRTYQGRIGGPLMDRIDIHIDVWRASFDMVLGGGAGTASEVLRKGVMEAREFASWRKEQNRGMPAERSIIAACSLEEDDEEFLKDMAALHRMSGRGIVKTLSIARTIADMDGREKVGRAQVCEALGLRLRDGIGAV
ncbi:YifB family Mg chelatase-like AAA ATPase [Raoultibacter phocaeensis]|uniref:YifB family Mg chelatase-like AAA ATPase n=1 Tax=Raoultibacter phocaeensis TaxID=2479841 RepID=UPI0011195523|nr:YifB family Mg chelatase-like AAA ATPase [Raoultibacter phocaeensis]